MMIFKVMLFNAKNLFTFLQMLLISFSINADEIKPFKSDGCSFFPEGTLKQNQLWHECCVEHDLAYWKGGSRLERKAADFQLKSCVENIGKPAIAKIMLAGVRAGGSPYWPTAFRWGYGWPYLRGYQVLSAEEKKMVEEMLLKFPN